MQDLQNICAKRPILLQAFYFYLINIYIIQYLIKPNFLLFKIRDTPLRAKIFSTLTVEASGKSKSVLDACVLDVDSISEISSQILFI